MRGADGKWHTELQDSDIVCFESMPDDEHSSHCAILTNSDVDGVFPPNTLFRLKCVEEPGTWRAPGDVFPRQRLLVVTATYLPPYSNDHIVPGDRTCGAKLCESAITLLYATRGAYIHGLDSLISKPVTAPPPPPPPPVDVVHRRCL